MIIFFKVFKNGQSRPRMDTFCGHPDNKNKKNTLLIMYAVDRPDTSG